MHKKGVRDLAEVEGAGKVVSAGGDDIKVFEKKNGNFVRDLQNVNDFVKN